MYAKGDVVLVPFPFTDQSSTSIRPALVMSSSQYNDSSGDVVVAMITSRRHDLPTDTAVSRWHEAGLLHESWVRAKLATISQSLIRFRPGALLPEDLAAVNSAIRLALEL
jgi:mRNA interferase MazF